jgi:hypothetical protein
MTENTGKAMAHKEGDEVRAWLAGLAEDDPEALAFVIERNAMRAALSDEERQKRHIEGREGTIKFMMDAHPVSEFPRYTREYVEKLYDNMQP